MNDDNTRILAGESFVERFPDHPWIRWAESPLARLYTELWSAVVRVRRKIQAKSTGELVHALNELDTQTQTELCKLCEDAWEKDAAFRREWQAQFGEAFPDSFQDWERWLARLDAPGRLLPAETVANGSWTYGELLPFVEGYLLRLKDLAPSVEQRETSSTSPNEDRDAWLYEEASKGTAYSSIQRKLAKKPKSWERLASVQGVRDAIARYCRRHGLPAPSRRGPGRKTGARKRPKTT